MRFLGIGEYCDLGALYLRLARDGHEVRVHVAAAESKGTLAGLIERVDEWRDQLPWIREVGDDGIILFERADAGYLQEELRGLGYNVVGGGAFGDRLEKDRAFGQAILASLGIATAPVLAFRDFEEAAGHVRGTPGRYAYKPNGFMSTSMDTYIGQLADGADMVDFLEAQNALWNAEDPPDFILMPYLDGVEVGVGAYFNGEEFLSPPCIDFEHKRFFPGDMGELTGEMGTVVSYRGAERLFDATLAKMADLLAETGYCGYININTIVNEDGVWPLEFTSRFGYPGFAILEPLQLDSWADILSRICRKSGTSFRTRGEYSVGVVLTVPPFPYLGTNPPSPSRLRVLFRGELTAEDSRHIHYGEVALEQGRLVTAGAIGQVMVVTGIGATIGQARDAAYALAAKVSVPNLRYRHDIGDRVAARDLALLRRWGFLPEEFPEAGTTP
jgi:phosphoribosylamine--glycine ligase